MNYDESDPIAIEVRRGYSRDHRPDLKQFVSNLCCVRGGGVPLFLEVASGNQSDRQEFGRLMEDFQAAWNVETLFVVDAAFYSAPNLQRVKQIELDLESASNHQRGSRADSSRYGAVERSQMQPQRLQAVGNPFDVWGS